MKSSLDLIVLLVVVVVVVLRSVVVALLLPVKPALASGSPTVELADNGVDSL